jgi:hypothetical protein
LGAVQHSVGVGSRGCRGNGASGSATQTWHPAAAPGRRRGKPRPPGFFPASCAPPSLSYFFTPSIFGGGDGFGLGSSSPRGRRRNREACWGLESYRWPARVWRSRDGRQVAIPRGVSSITRHQHNKRQPWGQRELAASPLSPSRRRHGEEDRGKKRWREKKRLTDGPHM